MKSKNWYDIEQVYKHQIYQSNTESASAKFEGLHYALQLIPLLKKSVVLSVAIRNVGFFTMNFHSINNEQMWVNIVPPSPILTGSPIEFNIALYGFDASQVPHILAEKRVSCLSLDDVVKIAEHYFAKL